MFFFSVSLSCLYQSYLNSYSSSRRLTNILATFRKLLPDTYQFDFVDGPYPDGPAAGIDLFYPPPYYKLYEHFTLESISEGHKWLLAYIKGTHPLSAIIAPDRPGSLTPPAHGPYDIVMCFSQGCSLASSLLLYNQIQHPNAPPLFKGAIFICGGVPLDVVASLGVEVTDEAREIDESSKVALMMQGSTEAILRDGYARWTGGFDPFAADEEGEEKSAALAGQKKRMVFGIDVARIPHETKIPIPTVHVFGSKDPRFPASVTLAQFCSDGLRRTYDHLGGHEIPRKKEVSQRITELVEWCVLMAGRW